MYNSFQSKVLKNRDYVIETKLFNYDDASFPEAARA